MKKLEKKEDAKKFNFIVTFLKKLKKQMLKQNKIMWMERRIRILRNTGKLNFSGEENFNVEALNDEKYQGDLKFAKSLNVSRIPILSFDGFPRMPKLTELIADYTKIKNLKNLVKAFPNLRTLSLKGIEIIDSRLLLISVLLLYPNLITFNGRLIPQTYREKAEKYPKFASTLVNNGWIAQYPVPSYNTFISLCQEYFVEFKNEELIPPLEDNDESLSKSMETELEFENMIGSLHNEHEQMLQRSQEFLGIINDVPECNVKLAEALEKHGIHASPTDDASLLRGISTLCHD